jgi:hypothetical protein
MTAMWCLLQRGRRAQTGLLDVVPGLATREDSGQDSKFPFWGFARFPFHVLGGSTKIPVPSWHGKAPLSADLP